MDLDAIRTQLTAFTIRLVFMHHFIEFASILRLRISHPIEPEWYLSFGGCTYVQGRHQWVLGELHFDRQTDGLYVGEDLSSDFRVVCESCHLISEKEYSNEILKTAAKWKSHFDQCNRLEDPSSHALDDLSNS